MGRHSQTSSLNTTLVELGALASRGLTPASGHGRRRAEGPASTPFAPMLFRAGGVAAALSIAVSGGAYAAVSSQGEEGTSADGAFGALGAEAPTPEEQGGGQATVVEGSGAEVSTVTEDATEAHGTVEQETGDLPEGERRVVTEGADGVVRTVYQVTTVDGEEVSRQAVSSVVVSEKVDEVVQVGTGAQEAAEPAADSSSDGSSQEPSSGQETETPQDQPSGTSSTQEGSEDSGSGDGSGDEAPSAPSGSSDTGSDDVWAALAQCESGGDPTANTGNGYYGMYQFSLSTWQAYGGSGLPSEASAAEQTAVAKRLQAAAGWGQWPHCAAQLGLL